MELLPLLAQSDEEIIICSHILGSKNRFYHYINTRKRRFDLGKLSDDFCWTHFRFYKSDIKRLISALNLPERIILATRIRCPAEEAMCILLKRLAYPNRYVDLMPFFPRSPSALSQIFHFMIHFILNNKSYLLQDFNQPWLSVQNIEMFSQRIHEKGSPYKGCFGFLDGTVRAICRPTYNQRDFYNGHKRVHALKFQSLMMPNGMIANMYGPIKGRRHDAHILAKSRLMEKMQDKFGCLDKNYYIYGDPAYPLRKNLMVPFKGANLDNHKLLMNQQMSKVREAVEWGFGKIIQVFSFLDFKKNLKIMHQPVADYYKVATILTNCHTTLYGSEVSDYFNCNPPTLEQYFNKI